MIFNAFHGTESRPRKLAARAAGLLLLVVAGGCGPADPENAGDRPPRPPEAVSRPPAPDAPSRGRIIYREGRSPSATAITAVLGEGPDLPATVVACANCHGEDGRGRSEGGITPTDITWDHLTKTYGGVHPSGRRFPPYTDGLLNRAITLGVDSDGRTLASTMPRYRMSATDMADLLAYLRQLGGDADPGVTDEEVRIGLLLPSQEAGRLGPLVRQIWTAYLDDLNRSGGMYHRQIRLCSIELSEPTTEAEVRGFLAGEKVLALAGGFLDGPDGVIARVADAERVPVIGTLSPPGPRGSPRRCLFHVYGGPAEQCRILAALSAERAGAGASGLAIIYESACAKDLADVVEGEWRRSGVAVVSAALDTDGANAERVAAGMKRSGIERVLLLAYDAPAQPFLAAANNLGWRPEVYAPAGLIGARIAEAPPWKGERFFFAFPTLSQDYTEEGLAAYRTLAKRHGFSAEHLAVQLATLASAKLFTEALTRCGRDLSRTRLITALEDGTAIRTGLTPPLRYSPSRRVGAQGAYVAHPGATPGSFIAVGAWRDLP
jgi:ABC-type branched-subunit amino acid transport system substrate-binding protein